MSRGWRIIGYRDELNGEAKHDVDTLQDVFYQYGGDHASTLGVASADVWNRVLPACLAGLAGYVRLQPGPKFRFWTGRGRGRIGERFEVLERSTCKRPTPNVKKAVSGYSSCTYCRVHSGQQRDNPLEYWDACEKLGVLCERCGIYTCDFGTSLCCPNCPHHSERCLHVNCERGSARPIQIALTLAKPTPDETKDWGNSPLAIIYNPPALDELRRVPANASESSENRAVEEVVNAEALANDAGSTFDGKVREIAGRVGQMPLEILTVNSFTDEPHKYNDVRGQVCMNKMMFAIWIFGFRQNAEVASRDLLNKFGACSDAERNGQFIAELIIVLQGK